MSTRAAPPQTCDETNKQTNKPGNEKQHLDETKMAEGRVYTVHIHSVCSMHAFKHTTRPVSSCSNRNRNRNRNFTLIPFTSILELPFVFVPTSQKITQTCTVHAAGAKFEEERKSETEQIDQTTNLYLYQLPTYQPTNQRMNEREGGAKKKGEEMGRDRKSYERKGTNETSL